jgi:hypothetical protein
MLLTHPKLLDNLNYESKGENNGRVRSRGTFPGKQHFKIRGACWNSKMETKESDKQLNYSHGLVQAKQQIG